MRFRIVVWLYIVSLLVMVSCQDNDVLTNKEEPATNNEIAYISVTLNIPSGGTTARAIPQGGENGDGAEQGQTNENKISNLTLFLYQSTDINQAITNETTITTAIYFAPEDIIGNTTKTRQITVSPGVYHVIAVINAGDLTTLFSGNYKVKDVCNFVQKSAWKLSGATYSEFVMSSAKDISLDLTGITTDASAAKVTVDIERIAARLDFIPSKSADASVINNYVIKEGANTTAKITINKIKLINKLTAGSYLIKRVATVISGTPDFLGDEEPVAGGTSTCYVIDPWTALKTENNVSGSHFNQLLGGAGTDAVTSMYTNYFNSGFVLNTEDQVHTSDYLLGYTLENTTGVNSQLNGYITGAMFETIFIPQTITSYDPVNISTIQLSNANAISFFAYDNKKIICNSLEAAEFTSLKSTQPDDFFAKVFTVSNTWQELQEYADRIKSNDLLGFKDYLTAKLIGKSMSDNLTETISWNSFILNTYGYSKDAANNVTLNQNSKDTKLLLSKRRVNCYENGLCYYPYWIRHSNDGTIQQGIMEFGIVRNNIYKLKVISFSGLGKAMPFDPNTDDPHNPIDESYVNMYITVTPWRVVTHPEIVL